MDYFDFATINSYITKNQKTIMNRLSSIELNERNLQNSSDLLCQVLDFSPTLCSDNRIKTKIKLKSNPSLNELLPNSESHIEIVDEPAPGINVAKQVVDEIVGKVIKEPQHSEAQKQNSESDNDEDDDDDDEYEKALERRCQEMDKRQNQTTTHDNLGSTHTAKNSVSKIANLFNESSRVRVFFFTTKIFVDLDINGNDTINTLKKMAVSQLDTNPKIQNINLTYKIPEAFEIRLVDDDDNLPNMDFGALEDEMNILQAKSNKFALVEKPNFKPAPDKNKLLGEIKNGEKMVNIKIYFKNDTMGSSSKIISMKSDDNLKNVLQWLLGRDLLKCKNIDLYYFVAHNSVEQQEDLDNEINLDTTINLLPSLELDLKFKKFPDVPDNVNVTTENKKETEGSDEKVYIYNDISAGKLQEFEVIKINKFNSKQERILGIDMYYIYNNVPKNKQNGIFNKFFGEKTKKPLRKIKDIKSCGIVDKKKFYIEMKKNDTEEQKKMIFEVKDVNTRNEILAKLQFLIKLNQE